MSTTRASVLLDSQAPLATTSPTVLSTSLQYMQRLTLSSTLATMGSVHVTAPIFFAGAISAIPDRRATPSSTTALAFRAKTVPPVRTPLEHMVVSASLVIQAQIVHKLLITALPIRVPMEQSVPMLLIGLLVPALSASQDLHAQPVLITALEIVVLMAPVSTALVPTHVPVTMGLLAHFATSAVLRFVTAVPHPHLAPALSVVASAIFTLAFAWLSAKPV